MTTGSPFPFLQAEWRHLAMLNFEVEPSVLRPFVPNGTELDSWNGRTYLSVVGFLFLNTRVLGLAIPFHRNFEEVNLRLYVRRRSGEGWRRAVVFINEMVPRAAIALIARAAYGENYVAVPMSHRIERVVEDPSRIRAVSYHWRHAGRDGRLQLVTDGVSRPPQDGSEEQFIAEHYWGYCAQSNGTTVEYRVEHPPWRIAVASEALLDCDVARLYGRRFAGLLETPTSAFLADGSHVAVYKGLKLAH